MSAPSYLLSRVDLMVKAPPMPSSLADSSLVSGGAALDFLLLLVELYLHPADDARDSSHGGVRGLQRGGGARRAHPGKSALWTPA